MEFYEFELERWQSTWENRVAHNLSESGVHPMTVAEVLALDGMDPDDFAATLLVYSQGNGSDQLRDAIAATYDSAVRSHILVTSGSSEANFVVCWSLLEPGDEVAIVTPTYMQTAGLARNFGATVRTIPLRADLDWEPDLQVAEDMIGVKTKLLIITNPNNPTGHVISDAAITTLVQLAGRSGAWVLVDEVYRGAERNESTTPSSFGKYERLVVSCGLSKAYGLPGLRIGWLLGEPDFVERSWAHHDYTVICPTPTSDTLATAALRHRTAVLTRTREILNTNYQILRQWLDRLSLSTTHQPPDAGAICWIAIDGLTDGRELAERLRVDHDVLIVPGEHFDMPGYVRLGFGNESRSLMESLEILGGGLAQALSPVSAR